MADVSKTGVWIDTKTGKVVEKQPAEGIQLVPPGGEIDARVQVALDAARPVENADAPTASETAAKRPNRKG